MIKSLHSNLLATKKPFFRNFSDFKLIISVFDKLEESKNNIVLTTHVNADPDGIGAIFGLYYLFSYFYPEKSIYFGLDKISKLSTYLLVHLNLDHILEKNSFSRASLSKADDFDLIICDTHNYSNIQPLDPDFVPKIQNIIILDHHLETEYSSTNLRSLNFRKNVKEFKCIENDFKASSELVLQFFYLLDKKIDLEYLKMLFLGIFTDSRRLILADSSLLKLLTYFLDQHKEVNMNSLFQLLDNDYSRSERIARLKAAQRVIIHQVDNFIVVLTNISSFEGLVARSLIQLGADISCAIAETKNEVRISLRGRINVLDELRLHLGELASYIASTFPNATGSGHKGASGINISGNYNFLEIRKKLEDILIKEIRLKKTQLKKFH